MHRANPKVRILNATCASCQASVEDTGSFHARDDAGPWIGPYAAYKCGLVIVVKRGEPECWNPCENAVTVAGRMIDVEMIRSRELTPEEIAARKRKELQELEEFMNAGRFQHTRAWFTVTISTG